MARKRWKSCVRRFACEFLANAATFRHPDSSKKIASFVLAGVLHPAHLTSKMGDCIGFFQPEFYVSVPADLSAAVFYFAWHKGS
ncbi:MAG: hypothetical protein ACLVF5_03320 [Lachnospiraceae bacterium]|uniref:hypothetical protein n=1 Tax=Candidatus Fimivicinus sp. TaxID=3056640 RepID=UPI0029118FEF|nr:hypothetical protein [Clostridiales bacterium]MDU5425182.1 hypothetical protein [Clostridiales bacterium]